MRVRWIATENPIEAQWRLLSQFAYATNIRKYLAGRRFQAVDDRTVEFISGCIRQGEAYFAAARGAPLDIMPLLLYYGASNLLAGADALLSGGRPPITHHGMELVPATPLASTQVRPVRAAVGALQRFAQFFSDGCALPAGAPWTVGEIFGSIPDVKLEYELQYPTEVPYTIPVEVVRRPQGVLDRIHPSDVQRYTSLDEALGRIVGLSEAYLQPQYDLEQMKYIVLYRRFTGSEIGTYSITGRKHLQVAHIKNGQAITPSQLLVLFMGLYALGMLSRYHPEIWTPFVRSDATGERLVVEKFLGTCLRFMPNLVLNVTNGELIQFTYQTEQILDLTTSARPRDAGDDTGSRG